MSIIFRTRYETQTFGLDQFNLVTQTGVIIANDYGSPAIATAAGTNPFIDVAGVAVAPYGSGVELNGHDDLTISGSVSGALAGVYASGQQNTIAVEPLGSIYGQEVGIYFAEREGGANEVTNFGQILTSGDYGIFDGAFDGTSDQDLTVVNGGEIAGITMLNGGDDTYRGVGFGIAVVDGGSGNDLLIGSAAGDDFTAGSGDDELIGNDGNDVLRAGSGEDILRGGEGNDLFQGYDGEEASLTRAFGGVGNDTFSFVAGRSQIDAGVGSDVIQIGAGHHTVSTGTGLDTVKVLDEASVDGLSLKITDLSAFDRVDLRALDVANAVQLLLTNGQQVGRNFVLDVEGDGNVVLTFVNETAASLADNVIA